MKKLSYLFILMLFGVTAVAQTKKNSDLQVLATTLSGCDLKVDTNFNFGVIDFTQTTKAVDFPLNFAPHAELPMKIKVQCTPNINYLISYETERIESPLVSGVGFKLIEGIILQHSDGTDSFLLSYIYNLEPEYLTMLHAKNINEIADGKQKTFNLLVGLQNPLERGYRYPAAGVYYGESILTMTF